MLTQGPCSITKLKVMLQTNIFKVHMYSNIQINIQIIDIFKQIQTYTFKQIDSHIHLERNI
jgi:hypothetical protein